MRTNSIAAWFSLLAMLMPVARAQEVAASKATLRVAIVGASLSAGFQDGPATGGSADNRTTALQKVVKEWFGDAGKVASRANVAMFTDPEKLGAQQIDRVVKDGADLVLGVDFLFWYGYGHVDLGGKDEQAVRLARFELGLQQLARLQATVLVGDLPDMHGAARRMLSPAQIPSVAIQQALNARLAAWVKEHANVHVLALGPMVAQMKEQGVALPLAAGAVQVPAGGMLQGDKLHPNRLGMAWLGFQLQDAIRAALPKSQPAPAAFTLEQFVTAAGADGELGDLAAKKGDAPAPAAGGSGKK